MRGNASVQERVAEKDEADTAIAQVEVDGQPLELPEDIEGVLLLNIPSYMGGVNLWASGAAYGTATEDAQQSFCDGILEVQPLFQPPSIFWTALQRSPQCLGCPPWSIDCHEAACQRGREGAQVCGVYGSWHLGQLQVGLSRAIRLAQCRSATITCTDTLALQIDGEPWQQSPASLDVTLKGQVYLL
jgi:diacylglycerol kinase (ATP)